ncbi:hypothetical protein BJV82DRAFT_711300 [Fennellomyces sp. T-0311]|nr:hypothetical protein BJV82DRAFT_711300 [Fennellomyces sp. T-0311]
MFSSVWKTVFKGFYNPVVPVKSFVNPNEGQQPCLWGKNDAPLRLNQIYLKPSTILLQNIAQVQEKLAHTVSLELEQYDEFKDDVSDISSQQGVATKESLYCPYKNCKKPQFKYFRSLWKHIGKCHCSALQATDIRYHHTKYTFTSSTGIVIHFDEHSADSINNGEEIFAEVSGLKVKKELKDQKIFHCHYNQCDLTFTSGEAGRAHVQSAHCPEISLPQESTAKLANTCTEKMIEPDVKPHNLLGNKETVLIKKVDDSFYCPYKGCGAKSYSYRSSVFKHLRKTHNFEILARGRLISSITTSYGEPIWFDESSRNKLDTNEKLVVIMKQKTSLK